MKTAEAYAEKAQALLDMRQRGCYTANADLTAAAQVYASLAEASATLQASGRVSVRWEQVDGEYRGEELEFNALR